MDSVFHVAFFAVAAGILVHIAYRAYRHGGIRAAFFDAPVKRTIGEVDLSKGGLSRSYLRVHLLEAGSTDSVVAVERVEKGLAHFEVTSFGLSEPQVIELVAHLQEALRSR